MTNDFGNPGPGLNRLMLSQLCPVQETNFFFLNFICKNTYQFPTLNKEQRNVLKID
jgi:hypothetical protein